VLTRRCRVLSQYFVISLVLFPRTATFTGSTSVRIAVFYLHSILSRSPKARPAFLNGFAWKCLLALRPLFMCPPLGGVFFSVVRGTCRGNTITIGQNLFSVHRDVGLRVLSVFFKGRPSPRTPELSGCYWLRCGGFERVARGGRVLAAGVHIRWQALAN